MHALSLHDGTRLTQQRGSVRNCQDLLRQTEIRVAEAGWQKKHQAEGLLQPSGCLLYFRVVKTTHSQIGHLTRGKLE